MSSRSSSYSQYKGSLLPVDTDLVCQVPDHYSDKIQFICVCNECEAHSRLACSYCQYRFHATHMAQVVRLRDFNSKTIAQSQQLKRRLEESLNQGPSSGRSGSGGQQQQLQKIHKSVNSNTEQTIERFKQFSYDLQNKILRYIAEDAFKVNGNSSPSSSPIENPAYLAEIQDFSERLSLTLVQSWKNQSPSDIEFLVGMYNRVHDKLGDFGGGFANPSPFGREESKIFKLVNKKIDYFFNQVNLILSGIINDLNFSIAEITAESVDAHTKKTPISTMKTSAYQPDNGVMSSNSNLLPLILQNQVNAGGNNYAQNTPNKFQRRPSNQYIMETNRVPRRNLSNNQANGTQRPESRNNSPFLRDNPNTSLRNSMIGSQNPQNGNNNVLFQNPSMLHTQASSGYIPLNRTDQKIMPGFEPLQNNNLQTHRGAPQDYNKLGLTHAENGYVRMGSVSPAYSSNNNNNNNNNLRSSVKNLNNASMMDGNMSYRGNGSLGNSNLFTNANQSQPNIIPYQNQVPNGYDPLGHDRDSQREMSKMGYPKTIFTTVQMDKSVINSPVKKNGLDDYTRENNPNNRYYNNPEQMNKQAAIEYVPSNIQRQKLRQINNQSPDPQGETTFYDPYQKSMTSKEPSPMRDSTVKGLDNNSKDKFITPYQKLSDVSPPENSSTKPKNAQGSGQRSYNPYSTINNGNQIPPTSDNTQILNSNSLPQPPPVQPQPQQQQQPAENQPNLIEQQKQQEPNNEQNQPLAPEANKAQQQKDAANPVDNQKVESDIQQQQKMQPEPEPKEIKKQEPEIPQQVEPEVQKEPEPKKEEPKIQEPQPKKQEPEVKQTQPDAKQEINLDPQQKTQPPEQQWKPCDQVEANKKFNKELYDQTVTKYGPMNYRPSPGFDPKTVRPEGYQINQNGLVYKGEWLMSESEIREGKGMLFFTDGSIYEGHWSKDLPDGFGRLISGNGNVYDGMWKEGKSEGKGITHYFNGTYYEGSWVDDVYHGYGTQTWPQGHRYEGEFIKGVRQGKGKFFWPDGSVYEGQFQTNKVEGHGILKWPDGRKYEGQLKDGKMSGKGTFTWPDGRIYMGDYIDDKKEGYGVFTFAGAEKKYEGHWQNDQIHGTGCIIDKSGQSKKGEWVDGQNVKWLD